jgi:hypothetical protein
VIWYWVITAVVVAASILLHRLGVIHFDTGLPWTAWLVVGLVLFSGGWMAFDGGRALVVGDYVTPRSGPHAGALGPWSKVVSAVGVEPRSTPMKSLFVVYGLAFIGLAGAFALGASKAWLALVVVAVLGLWYVPFGTVINAVVLTLLLLPPLRSIQSA